MIHISILLNPICSYIYRNLSTRIIRKLYFIHIRDIESICFIAFSSIPLQNHIFQKYKNILFVQAYLATARIPWLTTSVCDNIHGTTDY